MECKKHPRASNGRNKDGVQIFKPKCNSCLRPYRKYLKEFCEHCKFKPLHDCQLDVDHIDGDNNNNEESNLQTLCANCHRLKTHIYRDYLNKEK